MAEGNQFIISTQGNDCSFSNNVQITSSQHDIRPEPEAMREIYLKSVATLQIKLGLKRFYFCLGRRLFSRKFEALENIKNINSNCKITELRDNSLKEYALIKIRTTCKSLLCLNRKSLQIRMHKALKYWRSVSIYDKVCISLKSEVETKILKKYHNKNTAVEVGISKLNKEQALTQEKIKENQTQKQILESQLKEKNNAINIAIVNQDKLQSDIKDTKLVLSGLEAQNAIKLKADLEAKYSELVKSVKSVSDQLVEKDAILMEYIQEQNEILDYQEQIFYERQQAVKPLANAQSKSLKMNGNQVNNIKRVSQTSDRPIATQPQQDLRKATEGKLGKPKAQKTLI